MKLLVVGVVSLPLELKKALQTEHTVTVRSLDNGLRHQSTIHHYDTLLIWAEKLLFPSLKKFLQTFDSSLPIKTLVCGQTYTSQQRANLLDLGVKDCLPRVICSEELLAKIKTPKQLNQHFGQQTAFVRGDFHFDFKENQAFLHDKPILLNKKELLILRLLLLREGTILTRKTIYNEVWDSPTLPASNSLEVYLSSLRKKIEKQHGIQLIESVKGLGYRVKKI